MSLINQVLQDLDRRQASAAGVPASVRNLGARTLTTRPRPRWTTAAATALALATLVAVVMAWSGQSRGFATLVTAPAPVAKSVATQASSPATSAVQAPVVEAPVLGTRIDDDRGRSSTPSQDASLPSVATHQDGRKGVAAAPTPSIVAETDLRPGTARPDAATPARESVAVPVAVVPDNVARAAPALAASVELRPHALSAGERAEADYQRGLLLHQRGQDNDAEPAFAAAVQEDRSHVAARRALAITWIGRRRLDDAQRLLAEGLEFDGQDLSLSVLLARVRVEQLDSNGAIETLKAALAAATTSSRRAEQADARALLATLQQRAGRHAEAIDNYTAALRLVPSNGAWWVGLAVSLSAIGRSDTAQQAFERARATETLSPELAQYVEQRLRSLASR